MSRGARYFWLVVALLALVWQWPILWEIGLVGILAGAAWWLTQSADSVGGEDSGELSEKE